MESGLWDMESGLWDMESGLWVIQGDRDDVGASYCYPDRENEEEQKMDHTTMEAESEVPKEFKVSEESKESKESEVHKELLEFANNTIMY